MKKREIIACKKRALKKWRKDVPDAVSELDKIIYNKMCGYCELSNKISGNKGWPKLHDCKKCNMYSAVCLGVNTIMSKIGDCLEKLDGLVMEVEAEIFEDIDNT